MSNGVLLIPVILFCVIFWLEGVLPHLMRSMNRMRHAFPNVIIALMAAVINFTFIAVATQRVMEWHQAHFFGIFNLIVFSGFLKIVIAVVFFDLWMYIWHRLNHQVYLLWLLHRAHHNDVNMDVTTALRFHPVEIIISSVLNIGIVAVLGMTLTQFLVYNFILQVIIFFHHSNVALPENFDRLLRMMVVTPNMHRVHHSIEPAETNSNYSSIFSFWDRIFGTFKKRADTRTITYGLSYFREDSWQGLRGFLIIPFQRNVRSFEPDKP
jgi:sterol desaturase/sphingolipid hydroxylase (fatty acid hydroxylase superfamily)